MGIDIALVPGTGPKGRITEEDVKNYKPAAPAAPEQPEEPKVKASPLAAKVAADIGVDISSVAAHGRVSAADDIGRCQQGRRGSG